MGKHPVIGITGLACAGKSEVARTLAAAGFQVLDVDRLGHAALAEPACRARILARFGKGVLTPAGDIDRSCLRRLVFAAPESLRALEDILHPAMRARLKSELPGLRAAGPVALDAALLLPMRLDQCCDAVILVEARPQVRLRRARARGWTREELRQSDRRLDRAMDTIRPRADLVIENNGTVPALRDIINRFLKETNHAPQNENNQKENQR